jgi:hypothetical protein
MPAQKLKLAFKGRIRGQMRDCVRDLTQVAQYDANHPWKGLLDSTTTTAINQILARFSILLAQKTGAS